MKKKFIDFVVKAIIDHPKIISIIAVILGLLSILSMLFFMELDLSVNSLAGDRIEEVNEFKELISQFNVSGMINMVAQPTQDKEQQVIDNRKKINQIIYQKLNEKHKIKLIEEFQKYYMPKDKPVRENLRMLNDSQTNKVAIDILQIIQPQLRNSIINNLNQVEEDKKQALIDNLNKNETHTLEIIVSAFKKESIIKIISVVENLTGEERKKVLKSILEKTDIKDKIKFIKNLDSFVDKEALINEVTELENQINSIINNFITNAEEFAVDLEKKLLSDNPASRSKKGETMDDIVRGVMYSSDFSLSPDRLMYLILILPENDVSDVADSKIFAGSVDSELVNLKNKYQDELRIRRTGYAVIALEEEKVMVDGFWLMLFITIGMILLISFIGLRRLVYPVLSFIPLSVGVLIMFGIYCFFIQTINTITLITPMMLFGMGIDYSLHFGSRYGEVRSEIGENASQKDVLAGTFDSIGMGLFVGMITTVLALMSLITASIGGFIQLAVMASVGVLSSFLSMVFLLPIIVLWRERKYQKTHANFLSSKKFVGLGKFIRSWGGTLGAIIMILIALSGIYFIPKLQVEVEKDNMKPKSMESVQVSKELSERFDYSYTQTFFVVKGYDKLIDFLRELEKKKGSEYDFIIDLLEEVKIVLKKEIKNEKDDNQQNNPLYYFIEVTEDDIDILINKLKEEKKKLGGEDKYDTINTKRIVEARRAVRTFEKYGWEKGNLKTLPEVKEKFANKTNFLGESNEKLAEFYQFIILNYVDWETNEYLVSVPPEGYVWSRHSLKPHVNELNKIEDNTGENGTGLIKVWWFLFSNMMKDLFRSSIFTFGIVILVLALTTRSLKGTVICSISLFMTLFSTLSIMSMFGVKLSFFNIPALPLILGLGIDYTVHIYYRMMESGKSIIKVISSTGKAVLLTTLTTLAAFGTMAFAAHPGLQILGRVTSLGLIIAFLSSIFVVPTLVKLFYRKELNGLS
jgi:uncharacterized protein